MLLRAIRYCSTFELYIRERETLRMALLLNKYPGDFIDGQFGQVLEKFNINEPLTANNYKTFRKKVINISVQEKMQIDYGKTMFIHFT
jgi:hypothetical protein